MNPPTPAPDADLEPLRPCVPKGIYRHYKGRFYEVLDTVRHSETLQAMTLYRALYGARGLWVRPAAMFMEAVMVDGRAVPRFEQVPPDQADAIRRATTEG